MYAYHKGCAERSHIHVHAFKPVVVIVVIIVVVVVIVVIIKIIQYVHDGV